MKNARRVIIWVVFLILVLLGAVSPTIHAEEALRYSCSAQVSEAFETERLEAFTRATGIRVDLFIAPSPTCVNRLMNGACDIASTTRGLHFSHKESGYVETPFCRDALAVIVNVASETENVTKKQLREIFRREVTNWNQLGGHDQPVVLTVPGKNTGAYNNFHRQVMRMKAIEYDYSTYQSTQIIELVKQIPGTISFIARGAVVDREGIKIINVDGISPTHKDYPLSQIFSFITRGNPTGPVKVFVDFALSEVGRTIMKKKGMVPIQ